MTKNIIFIDSRVPDYHTLISSLGTDTSWYLLNPDENGVDQMAQILSDYRDLDSVQIFSHGSEGSLQLGAGVLDASNLDDHVPALQTIGNSLADSGDILLYGCDVASGETGNAFIQALAERTGADITASADITGKGGDWDLEAETGTIEASGLSIPDYAHTLAADTTAPELTSLVIPETVDLSQGDVSFTISAGATDDLSGVDRVVVWFGDEIATDIGSYRLVIISDSYSDSWADGASSVTRTVLDTNQPGTYQVTKVDIEDHQGNSRSYTTSELEALGFNTSLTLTGSTADTTAPELTSLVIPETVDLSQGDVSFTISAGATDDLSGVDRVVVWFGDEIATDIGSYRLVIISDSYSDSWADGASSVTRTVLDTNQPGTYQVTKVDIEDHQGNSRSYTTSELEALGFNTSLTLTGSTADTTAPELTSLVIPETVDLSQGDVSFTISAGATDDLSGVDRVVVWFGDEIATDIGSYRLVIISDSYSDSWADGASSVTRTVLDTNQPGTYQVTKVDIEDHQGNSRSYTTSELEALGFNTTLNLTHGAVDNTPLAEVTTEFVDGVVEVTVSPSQWLESTNEITLQIGYDASQFSFKSASLIGSGSSSTSSSISEVGNTGSASLTLSLANGQHSGAFKLTFVPETSTVTTFDATIDSISINGASGTLEIPAIAISPVNHVPTGEVSISGMAVEGETLSVSHTLADEDGLGTLSYQWLADGVAIAGAIGESYTLTAGDVGKHLSVQASYTDGRGQLEALVSSSTAVIEALPEVSTPVTGQVYHWKNHALLTDVELKLAATGSGTSTATGLYELRNIELGADGRVTFELWTNLSSAVGSLDVSLALDPDAAVEFTAASDSQLSGWQLLGAQNEQGTFGLGAFGLTEISGAVQLGQLSLTLPGGMTQTRIEVSGEAGDGASLQTQRAYTLTAGYQQATTDADGAFDFELLEDSAYSLDISKALTEGETGRAINSADALAALKIAVGLNPNADPDGSGPLDALELSPYQLIAADVNQDGRVNSADALSILKMAVQRSDAPEREWLFVSESENFWDEAANHGEGGYTTTRSNVDWNQEQVIDGSLSNLNQVAVLKGDVNGSWSAPADSQYVPDDYFNQLELAGTGPASQWAVLPV